MVVTFLYHLRKTRRCKNCILPLYPTSKSAANTTLLKGTCRSENLSCTRERWCRSGFYMQTGLTRRRRRRCVYYFMMHMFSQVRRLRHCTQISDFPAVYLSLETPDSDSRCEVLSHLVGVTWRRILDGENY